MITILVTFTGYPDETGKGVTFRAGETVEDLPKAFVDMIIAKGLAVAKKADKAK